MNKSTMLIIVLALVSLSLVAFGQSINVIDNGPATPTETLRNFGDTSLPVTKSVNVSVDSATTTTDVTRSFSQIPVNIVSFKEVASTSSLVAPTKAGVITFQFNTDDNKLYIRLIDSNGTDWGCVATLSDDMTAALN